MEVIGADPFLSVQGALNLSNKVKYVKSNKEIFETCDYITVHVPLTPETKDMINAVVEALANGGMAAYVTDFPGDKILGVDGVVALPHLGASTPESEDNCAVMAANEIKDYLENGNIVNSVNLPNVSMSMTGDAKICVIHKNVEGLIAKITTCITEAGMNIENMESKSKKDYAYTVLDVKGNADSVADKIRAGEAVISVRVIK